MRTLLGLLVVVAVAFSSQQQPPAPPPPGATGDTRLRAAAGLFVAALRPESRALATFAFDDPLRTDWHFIPRDRKGLPLGAMSDDERRAAHALLRAFLTPRGYGRALGVIELESVLREIENNPGRDPGRYFFSLFGDPAGAQPWALRVEGHHLALNFTGAGVEGVAPTPFFLGANPAEVRSGARAGFKLLAPHEELARRLVKSLDAEQRKLAVIAETAPADVLFGPGKKVEPDAREGMSIAGLRREQLELFLNLIRELADDVALPFPGSSDLPTTRFAWAGGLEPGQGHYWRLSGSNFVFEYDNTQNDANHVHFLWRDPKNDFAADWLARHHAAEH